MDDADDPGFPEGSSAIGPAFRVPTPQALNTDAVSESHLILPGPAGMTLLIKGLIFELAGLLTGAFLSLESYLPGRWYYWAAAILPVVGVLLVVGLVTTVRGNRRLAEEKRRGYTTALGDAWKDPSLYYVDRVSLRIVAAPHEPRPRHRKSQ